MKPSVRLTLIGLIAVLPAAAILVYEAAAPALPAAIVLGALAAAALAWAAHRLLSDSDPATPDAETAHRERELLRAKHAAETASRAKTEFLAVVSHEVRTPLNAVIGFSEMLREGYAGPVDEKQREYLDDILVSARHLLRLMGDMLDMSAIEAGRIAVRPMLLPLR
ncbi:MAG TPA: histidine kinase dimerization/phospho-acceptor domain-containing protein, partial [Stellaceae bacterium]|nr:histidine kinase dimerization/phospho-acceptor domain-containing protein [Stellaceae bacterium]